MTQDELDALPVTGRTFTADDWRRRILFVFTAPCRPSLSDEALWRHLLCLYGDLEARAIKAERARERRWWQVWR